MIKILQGYILQGQPTNQFNDVSARKPLEGLNEPRGGGSGGLLLGILGCALLWTLFQAKTFLLIFRTPLSGV